MPGRPAGLDSGGARAYIALALGAVWVVWIFLLPSIISLLSLSLGDGPI